MRLSSFRFLPRFPSVSGSAVQSSFQRSKITPVRGRFHWWKEPVYFAPHVHPLERGVDFTFQDSRPISFTSRAQVKRKMEQIELGKKIVKLLGELKEAEDLSARSKELRLKEEAEIDRWMPKVKGDKPIS